MDYVYLTIYNNGLWTINNGLCITMYYVKLTMDYVRLTMDYVQLTMDYTMYSNYDDLDGVFATSVDRYISHS